MQLLFSVADSLPGASSLKAPIKKYKQFLVPCLFKIDQQVGGGRWGERVKAGLMPGSPDI